MKYNIWTNRTLVFLVISLILMQQKPFLIWTILLVLMLNVPVNNFPVMASAKGHNKVPPISLGPDTLDFNSNTLHWALRSYDLTY